MDDATLAETIATAVTSCPGVAGLHDGGVATYLPGRRISGVDITVDAVTVEVVACSAVPLPQLADDVRSRVKPLVEGRRVDITVADLDLDALDVRSAVGPI